MHVCVRVYRPEVDTGHLSLAFHLMFLHRSLEFADWLVCDQQNQGSTSLSPRAGATAMSGATWVLATQTQVHVVAWQTFSYWAIPIG